VGKYLSSCRFLRFFLFATFTLLILGYSFARRIFLPLGSRFHYGLDGNIIASQQIIGLGYSRSFFLTPVWLGYIDVLVNFAGVELKIFPLFEFFVKVVIVIFNWDRSRAFVGVRYGRITLFMTIFQLSLFHVSNWLMG